MIDNAMDITSNGMSNEIRLFQSKTVFLVNFFLFGFLPKSFQHQQRFNVVSTSKLFTTTQCIQKQTQFMEIKR